MSFNKVYLIVRENYERSKYDLKMVTMSLDMANYAVRFIVKDETLDAAGVAYEIEIGVPVYDDGCYCWLNVVAEYNTKRKLQLDHQFDYNTTNSAYDQPLIIEPDEGCVYLVIHHHDTRKISAIVMAETSLEAANTYAHELSTVTTASVGDQQVVVYSIPINEPITMSYDR